MRYNGTREVAEHQPHRDPVLAENDNGGAALLFRLADEADQNTRWAVDRLKSQQQSEWNMLHNQRIAVVLPAFNAEKTLRRTFEEIPHDIVDDVILTDDASSDRTVEVASELGIFTVRHERNRGYGANQKTCYSVALSRGADIVIMLHPDYQYAPKLATAMASMIASGEYDVVLGSRILGNGALKGGMPLYKYVGNRILTLLQNLMVGQKLSEYHTGYRAWRRAVLENLPLHLCSDAFVFDNQMLVQAIGRGFKIGEISCPTSYHPDASSIDFKRGVVYAMGVLKASMSYLLHRLGIRSCDLLSDDKNRSLIQTPSPDASFQ